MSNIQNAGAEIRILAEKIVQNTGQQVVARGVRATEELRNAALDVLSGERSGRIYRKRNSRSTYRASAPGEPPASDSGNLRRNWRKEVGTAQISGGSVNISPAIISKEKYSGYLENGTSRMAPRPYRDRILEKAKPRIVSIYSEPYRR